MRFSPDDLLHTMLPPLREQNATMEWQIIGYCLVSSSWVEAFPVNIPSVWKPNPICKMALKSKGCSACRLRSCCDLAERNARLFLQNKISAHRFEQLSIDLKNTCEIAFMYQNWLLSEITSNYLIPEMVPPTTKRLHTKFKERKQIMQKMGILDEVVAS